MDCSEYFDAIKFGLEKLNYTEIKPNQRKVVESYLNGKDVFFCSPTGSGKSLTFEIAPFVFQYLNKTGRNIILVVSPLTALMQTQSQSLQKKGIKAVYLRDVTPSIESSFSGLALDNIEDGQVNIIIASPESLLGRRRDLLINVAKQKLIKAVFIDEAHCIKKFGKPDKKNKKAVYRPCYGQLAEIRSIVGGDIPVVALTATATSETKKIILKDLCMENCVEVTASPDKKNITYWVHKLESDDICANFQWLVRMLKEHKGSTARMIIFFRQIKYISEVYEHLITSLDKDAYLNFNENGPNDDRNRLFDMYHMKTDEEVKDNICSSYQNPDGNIRVVLCSTSFSMGLDVKGVDTVIHYGPANDIDDYLQESGRAGRDLSCESHAILLLYKRCTGSRNISPQMKEYVKTKACRRKYILNVFGTTPEQKSPVHLCCDNCLQFCKCECKCQLDECRCSIKCSGSSSTIYDAIKATSGTYSDDESQSSGNTSESSDEENSTSSDSDVQDLIRKKPQIVYSSDDELF